MPVGSATHWCLSESHLYIDGPTQVELQCEGVTAPGQSYGSVYLPTDYEGQAVEWSMANSDITSFIHKKRCASGSDGTMVTSPGGVTWKKCAVGVGNTMAVAATYQLPPFVCAQTCDQNPGCTAYAVDSAQQNCYIGGPTGGGNYTMYYRLPGL